MVEATNFAVLLGCDGKLEWSGIHPDYQSAEDDARTMVERHTDLVTAFVIPVLFQIDGKLIQS